MTGRSIEFAMEEAFTPLYGARKDEDAVQKILIVLTDGRLEFSKQATSQDGTSRKNIKTGRDVLWKPNSKNTLRK